MAALLLNQRQMCCRNDESDFGELHCQVQVVWGVVIVVSSIIKEQDDSVNENDQLFLGSVHAATQH